MDSVRSIRQACKGLLVVDTVDPVDQAVQAAKVDQAVQAAQGLNMAALEVSASERGRRASVARLTTDMALRQIIKYATSSCCLLCLAFLFHCLVLSVHVLVVIRIV